MSDDRRAKIIAESERRSLERRPKVGDSVSFPLRNLTHRGFDSAVWGGDECPECEGSGEIHRMWETLMGPMPLPPEECEACEGTGLVPSGSRLDEV